MLPLDAGSGTEKAQTSSGHLRDTDIATALVHAIRAVPGVLEMGQGVFARVATYGPGTHIAGIVLAHPTPAELAVEVHVILDERVLSTALAEASSSAETPPLLLRWSDQVRAVVSHTLEQLGMPVPTLVDVTIDDLR